MPLKIKPLPDREYLLAILGYDPISGVLTWKAAPHPTMSVGAVAGSPHKTHGYVAVGIGRQYFKASRIIWLMMTGNDPGQTLIDHRDRNRSNNAWTNLRLATSADNARNQKVRSDNTTGFRGVTISRKGNYVSYRATIAMAGRNLYLGRFKTPELAAEAYRKKAVELHGDFANF